MEHTSDDLVDFSSDLEQTLDMDAEQVLARAAPKAPSREELVEFIRWIIESERGAQLAHGKVYGQRAIELAAWPLYERLLEAGEI